MKSKQGRALLVVTKKFDSIAQQIKGEIMLLFSNSSRSPGLIMKSKFFNWLNNHSPRWLKNNHLKNQRLVDDERLLQTMADKNFLYEYYKDYMRHRESPELLSMPIRIIDQNIPTVTTINPSTRYDLARKIPVLSNAFYMQSDATVPMEEFELYNVRVEDDVLGDLEYSYLIRCESMSSLRQWLVDADALIKSSKLTFLTELIAVVKYENNCYRENVLSVDPRKMKFKVSETIPAWIDVQEYLPLFQLDLPYIEGIDLRTLNRVMDDYPEEFGAFRDYLSNALAALPSAMGGEQSSKAIQKIQSEINGGARFANIEYRKFRNISGLRLGATAAATWSLLFYAFFSDSPDVVRVLGPGGAISLVAKEVADYLQSKYDLKKNQFAFLALVKHSRR